MERADLRTVVCAVGDAVCGLPAIGPFAGRDQLAAGAYHNLALKSDGTVVGWGYNGEGQVSVPDGLSNVVSVAAGFYHSLALKAEMVAPEDERILTRRLASL